MRDTYKFEGVGEKINGQKFSVNVVNTENVNIVFFFICDRPTLRVVDVCVSRISNKGNPN